jgi:threonine/homoserine/homoserine lactone efflux protein
MPVTAARSVSAFAVIATMLVLTPGVGTAYLLSTVIGHGRRAGYRTALGMVLGAGVHAVIAAAGMAVLLHAFPDALRWVAIVGGLFIIWIGARGLIRSFQPAAPIQNPDAVRRGHSSITMGALVALGNAPLPLFYLVVVPQYVPRDVNPLAGALGLSLLHMAIAGTWMATLVTLVGELVDVLRRPRVLLTMQLLTGLVLIVLGVRSITGAL